MKKIIFLIGIGIFISCGSGKVGRETVLNQGNLPDGVKGSINGEEIETGENTIFRKESHNTIHFSTPDQIKKLMEFLASDELKGRDSGSEGIAKAANYAETIFKANGIKPYFKTYKDTLGNFKKQAYNVVGLLEGTDSELKSEHIIIGAHYDHLGEISPENGDAIANGANDNATGTSTVLELARYFGNAGTNKRSIVFVLFSAEEKGLLGSKHLAEKLKKEDFNLYTMLNFEMVGVPMVGKDHLLYITGHELSNMADIANGYAGEKIIGFLPKAKAFNLFQRSDNYPFHTAFNIPSQTYSTFDFTNFEHYHKVSDENELIDYEHMAKVVNKMIPVIEGIANAPIKEISYH
ncbi:M28 family metallopeptidase [Maribacter sp. 2304DJ31-5]|uniref:M28 family metallopeptidase n=1 Tax=Maribacter sp. 2304DJ31-5 TaxID=3386273 RepID=UPI0039BC2B07